MAEHVWSVLCDRSVIDKSSNQVSLLNVVESLKLFVDKEELDKLRQLGGGSEEAPSFKRRMHFVTWWVRSALDVPETVPIRIVVISPRGERGGTASATVDLSEKSSYRIQIVIDGLKYLGEGRYWFAVEQKVDEEEWSEVARVPLSVAVTEANEENMKVAGLRP